MRGYELCLIIQPGAGEEEIDTILNGLQELISKHSGEILKTEKWGKRNLKYPIKKQSKGNYCFLNYLGNNEILYEIDRALKFNESVLRYYTIRMEINISIDKPETVPAVEEEKSFSEDVTQKNVSVPEAESPPADTLTD